MAFLYNRKLGRKEMQISPDPGPQEKTHEITLQLFRDWV